MYVFDCEANGLHPDKFYCLSYHNLKTGESKTLTTHEEMKEFLENADFLIGHNIIRWDIPNLCRVLGINIDPEVVCDTLALSWYLFPKRPPTRHGLGDWGIDLGIAKPEVLDWHNLKLSTYIHRCEEDVKINTKLWSICDKYLSRLYETEGGKMKLISYLRHKMNMAHLQEESKWKLDIPKVKSVLSEIIPERDEKVRELAESMPPVPITKKRGRPSKPLKKDGTLSAHGQAWQELLKSQGLPEDFDGEVEYVDGYKPPNPNSHPQLKDWLFSLGWKPQTFKIERHKKTGKIKETPQISNPNKDDVCESVKELFVKEPSLQALAGLFLLNHRISILNGFLENVDDEGYLKAEIAGFTNTLRFKHSIIVNLPGVDKPYGKEIRGCLTVPDKESMEICGSDMSSLEDRTKQHFIFYFDPEYVREMQKEDFDPHIDLAILANMMTFEEGEKYKNGDNTFKPIRHKAKTTNYACTYGAQPTRVAVTAGIPVEEAETLVNTYWKRNWAIKKVAEELRTKEVKEYEQIWVFNPVSRFWYSLRHHKDKFSTLNQGTATYCFDTWVYLILVDRPQLTAQFHDEIVLCVKKGYREEITKFLKDKIREANEILKLNRELDIGVEFGPNYAEVH